jgi:AraC-like DNA-binding protein
MTAINVKNMVCNRCIKVITEALFKNNIYHNRVDLGVIYFDKELSSQEKIKLNTLLKKEEFEIIENYNLKIVNQVKSIIIDVIHRNKEKPLQQNFSEFIALDLKMDYSSLSKIFSLIENRTIEHYIIEQRIEKVKELLIYNELTLSQISYELDYSSPQHLSKQFKKVTSLTPTQFKKVGKRKKLDTI